MKTAVAFRTGAKYKRNAEKRMFIHKMSETPPQMGQKVLALVVRMPLGSDNDNSWHQLTYEGEDMEETDYWTGMYEAENFGPLKVSHWMPLPELPKGV